MANKKYYWLKLKEDFFEEDAIAWIEEQDKGKEYCLFYLKLCLKSLKTNGLLIRNVGSMLVPYDAKTLAKVTSTDIDTVKVAMDIFTKIGLVQILENGEIFISQLQNMVGSETSKAQLMRNKRARDKKLIEGGNNVTTLLPGSYSNKENCYTDIEKDIEKDIDIHKDKEDKYVGKSDLKSFRILYEQNIGLINGITAEYLIELSETIDVNLFKRAIEIATDRGKCSLGYVKGIIKQWLDINIKTLEQLEVYKLQQEQSKKGVKTNGSSTKRTKQFEQQIPVDDEKDEEYYRLLKECERLSRE